MTYLSSYPGIPFYRPSRLSWWRCGGNMANSEHLAKGAVQIQPGTLPEEGKILI